MLKRLALLLALLPLAAEAKAPPRAVKAEPGMVSAADPRATAAGVEILRAGGTAADAAVAMMAALNVVEPLHSGLGGGGFLVYSDAQHRTTSYDGRETAPAAADPYWFYVDGKPLKHNDAVPGGRFERDQCVDLRRAFWAGMVATKAVERVFSTRTGRQVGEALQVPE